MFFLASLKMLQTEFKPSGDMLGLFRYLSHGTWVPYRQFKALSANRTLKPGERRVPVGNCQRGATMCGSDFVQPFNDRARCSQNVANWLPAWQVFSCSPHTVVDFKPNLKNVTFTGTMTPGRNGQGSQTLYSFTGGQHG